MRSGRIVGTPDRINRIVAIMLLRPEKARQNLATASLLDRVTFMLADNMNERTGVGCPTSTRHS